MDDHRYGAHSDASLSTATASPAAALGRSSPAAPVTELMMPKDGQHADLPRPAPKGTSLNFFLEKEYFINGSYCCPVCKLRVTTKRLLEQHVDAHEVTLNVDGTKHVRRQFVQTSKGLEPSLPENCHICNMKFSNQPSLQVHMDKEHSKEVRKRRGSFFCEVCRKSLLPTTNVKRHMLTHSSIKPFPCTLCEKAFSSAFSLKSHLLVHSGARPFRCNVCGEAFRTQSILTVHTRRHTNETPYSCPDCDKKFKDGAAFHRHRFTHNTVKPFQCKLCPKGYTTAQSLKIHEMSHGSGAVSILKQHVTQQHKEGHFSALDEKRSNTVTSVITVIGNPDSQRKEGQEQVTLGQGRKQTFISLLSNSKFSVLGESASSANGSQSDSHGRDDTINEGIDFLDDDGIGVGPVVEVSVPSGNPSASNQVTTTLLSASLSSSASPFSAETSAAVASINFPSPQASCEVNLPSEQQRALVVDIATMQDREKEDNSFQCQLCEKSFPLMHLLSSHLQVHVGVGATRCGKCRRVVYDRDFSYHPCSADMPKPHVCHVCHKMFSDAAKFSHHVVSCARERHFQCNRCRRRFTTSAALESHKLIHSEDKQYQCPDCKKMFARHHDLQIHRPVHSQGKRFGCPYCDKRCRTKTQLNSHLKCHTNERNYRCPYCDKTFARSNEFNVHMRSHTGERPFSCKHCSRRFTTGYALHLHSFTHSLEHSFQCPQCSVAYKSAPSLKRHMLSHEKVSCHQCSMCQKRFTSRRSLNAHATTHLAETEKPFQCQRCSQGFLQERLLLKHEAVHLHGDTRFACPVCQKNFRTEVGCKNHMKIHTRGEFHCSICDRVFHTRSELHHHEVADHKSSFKCDRCERVFKTARWLKSHVCGPPQKTPYLCPHCPNTYSSARFLEKHIQRHLDNEESNPCPVCQKSFPTEFGLDNHLETHAAPELEKVYTCCCFQCGKKFRNVDGLDRHVKFCCDSPENEKQEDRRSNRTLRESVGAEEQTSLASPDASSSAGELVSDKDVPAQSEALSPAEKTCKRKSEKMTVDVQTDVVSEDFAEEKIEDNASVPGESEEQITPCDKDGNLEKPTPLSAGVLEGTTNPVEEVKKLEEAILCTKETSVGGDTASVVRSEIQGTFTNGGGGDNQGSPPDSQSQLQHPEQTVRVLSPEVLVESVPQGAARQESSLADSAMSSECLESAADGEAPTQYQCSSCLGLFPSEQAVLAHAPQCISYQCASCGNIFSSATAILEHVPTCSVSVALQEADSMTAALASPAATFKCSQCVEVFSSKAACLDHTHKHASQHQTSKTPSARVTPPVQLVLKKHVENIKVLTPSVTETTPVSLTPSVTETTPVSSSTVTPERSCVTSTMTPVGASVAVAVSGSSEGSILVPCSDSPLSQAQIELILQLASQALVGKGVSSLTGVSQDMFLEPSTELSTPVQLFPEKLANNFKVILSPAKKNVRNPPLEKPFQPMVVDGGSGVEIMQQPSSFVTVSSGSNTSSLPMKSLLGTDAVHLKPPSPAIRRRKRIKTAPTKSASVCDSSTTSPQTVKPKPKPQSLLTFMCTECQRVFPTLSLMVSHKSLAHAARPPPPPPVFPCLICHREFSSEEELNDAASHNCALVRQLSGLPVSLVSGRALRREGRRARGRKRGQAGARPVPLSSQPSPGKGSLQEGLKH